jgi:hypothetical protein
VRCGVVLAARGTGEARINIGATQAAANRQQKARSALQLSNKTMGSDVDSASSSIIGTL